jgi:uncharacterized protein (TIGR03437 family)
MIVAIPSTPGALLPVKDLSTIRLELVPRGSTQVIQTTVVAADSEMVWAVVPANAPIGRMDVTLTVNRGSASGNVYIARSSSGLFSAIRDGSGPGIAQNIADGAAPVRNQLTSPALPGQYMTLWGTGFGDFTTPDVSVDIYGTVVQPIFAGHAPGQPGLDQVNFRLPANVPASCYVPVTVTVGGKDVSNQVTVATAASPGRPCAHPSGLSADQLKTLDQGGTVTIGSLETQNSAHPSYRFPDSFEREETVRLSFLVVDSQRAFTGALGSPAATPACSLTALPTFINIPLHPYTNMIAYSDAGPSIILSGPGQRNSTIPSTSTGLYSKAFDSPPVPSLAALPAPFTAGGLWTVAAPGGAGAGAFQRTFTLPPPLNWTNRDALTTIDRSADLLITWDSGTAAPTELVTVQLSTFPPAGAALPSGLSSGVSCTVAGQTGKMTITRNWLQKIVSTLPNYSSQLGVTSDLARVRRFDVPLKAGGTVPVAVSRSSSESIGVVIR